MTRKINRSAFSLIEISIVIVILAILISFIPDVLELKNNAKISKVRALTQSSPIQHMDNLIIWYETSMLESFTKDQTVENAKVSIWHNRAPQSKNVNNAFQNSVANQPTYKKNIYNDVIPALYFDGSDDFLQFDGSKMVNSDFSIFVVEMRTRGAINDYFIGGTNNSLSANFHMGYGATNYMRYGIYGSSTSNYTIPSYSEPIPRISSFKFSINLQEGFVGSKFWVNGGDAPDQRNTNSYYLKYYLARIGDTENQHFYQGYIAEIIIFSRAISDQERREVEDYLSKKYQIILD